MEEKTKRKRHDIMNAHKNKLETNSNFTSFFSRAEIEKDVLFLSAAGKQE